MYRLFSYLYPRKLRDMYLSLLRYSNVKTDPALFLGFSIVFSMGMSLALGFLISAIFDTSLLITSIVLFLVLQTSTYFYFSLKIDARAKAIELILPDALQLMASNLKAGLTTDRALLLAARPEFGPLKDELNEVGKEVTIGKDIADALIGITKRVKSNTLEKTILLIVSGIKSGGELASLLEQVAKNLRQRNLIRQKIKASVLMYVIFIFAAIGFGAPILFGLSSYLVSILSSQLAQIAAIEIPASVTPPFAISGVNITEDFVVRYSIISLISTSILGSFVLGLIVKGKENQGVKFIPALIGITVILFFLVRYIMESTLSGLFA